MWSPPRNQPICHWKHYTFLFISAKMIFILKKTFIWPRNSCPFETPHRTLRWQEEKKKSYRNSLSLATKPTTQSKISTLSQVLSPHLDACLSREKRTRLLFLEPVGSGKLRLHTLNHISNKVHTTTSTITPISPRKHATHKNSRCCCLHFSSWPNCPSSPCQIKYRVWLCTRSVSSFPYQWIQSIPLRPSMVTAPTTNLDSGRKLADKNALRCKGIFVPL